MNRPVSAHRLSPTPVLNSKRLTRAFRAACDSATAQGHAFVGCEHLLSAMTADGHGWAVEVFVGLGVLDEVRDSLTRALNDLRYRWPSAQPQRDDTRPDEPAVGGPPRATPRLRACYRNAAELGRGLGQDSIGFEHLLVALAEDENGVCRQIFDRLGIAGQVAQRSRTRLTSESFNVRDQCIVISAGNRYLGLPVVTGGELWVQRPNGKVVPVQELC